MSALFPLNEAQRQRELTSYQILDTPPDRAFDNLVELAAEICEVPIALVSFLDNDRQWFKAKLGLDAQQTPRDQAFCAHAILNPAELLIVPDARKDSRFAENPLVTGNPNIRFYAGAPLTTPSGNGMGTLCVIDRQPRTLRPSQERALRALSLQANELMNLHRERVHAENYRRFLHTVQETLAEGVVVRTRDRTLLARNTMACVLLGRELEIGSQFSMLQYRPMHPAGYPMPTEELPSYKALATGEAQRNVIFRVTRPNKSEVWLEANASVFHDPVHSECAVISFRDISDRMEAAQHLQREATSDALTGLPNRRAFLVQVEKAIAAATRYQHPMSLCLCDLDRFKTINDQHGHAAGDAALRHFAKLLRASLRHEDTVARLGGDEFTALFTYVSASQAAVCLERLRDTLARTPLVLDDGRKLSINGSFGLAEWQRGMSAEQLLDAADKVLYDAKASGRNRVALRS